MEDGRAFVFLKLIARREYPVLNEREMYRYSIILYLSLEQPVAICLPMTVLPNGLDIIYGTFGYFQAGTKSRRVHSVE
jgi:hypothetical protein